MGTPADKISVAGFRQIYHWPLSLADPAQAEAFFNQAGPDIGPWVKTDIAKPPYEEAVYFHDFVQDFLYARDDNGKTRLHFTRDDLREITFTIAGVERSFVVEELTLDLFRFGSAVITLHLIHKGETNLAHVQTMIDHMRRAFPGFWKGSVPGLCPSGARIDDKCMTAITPTQATDHLHRHGAPKLFDWWQAIAGPLNINDGSARMWRHVLDERIPVMSWIKLSNDGLSDAFTLSRISEGDWHRIAAADEAGNNDMPYNRKFLQEQASALFYDRFMPDDVNDTATRHCFAGYHYALVGAGDFFTHVTLKHFTGHYRQMVFIAHLEFATMLTFSRRITNLIAKGENATFAKDLHAIRQDLLDFRHRFHFTHVSNHLQAREMNTLLRRSLDIETLADDVEAELNSASDFALAQEQGAMARSQARLTEFATLYLPVTLAAGFSGMNLLTGLPEGEPLFSRAGFAQFFGWGTLAYLFAWLTLLWTSGGKDPSRDEQSLMCLIGIITAGLGLAYVLTSGFTLG